MAVAKEWNGITPLASNCGQVEKLLGPNEKDDFVRYRLADASVSIWYSLQPCSGPEGLRWKIPADTVVSLQVTPRQDILLSSLNLAFSTFKKVPGARDMVGHYFYLNAAEGFTIEAQALGNDSGEIVGSYTYGPSNADEETFQCPEKPERAEPRPL